MNGKLIPTQTGFREFRVQKVAIAPAGSAINIGWRTGVDVKAGKVIRIDAEGFENFSDYFTSPEPDQGSDSSSVYSPVSTSDGRQKVLQSRHADNKESPSMLTFTPVPDVSSTTCTSNGNTRNEILSSDADLCDATSSVKCPAAASLQPNTCPGAAHESTEQTDTRACLMTNTNSSVEILKIHVEQQEPLAPSPERFGTRKRLTYSKTPATSSSTFNTEGTTGIDVAVAGSTDDELKAYAEKLKTALNETTGYHVVNEQRSSGTTVDNEQTHCLGLGLGLGFNSWNHNTDGVHGSTGSLHSTENRLSRIVTSADALVVSRTGSSSEGAVPNSTASSLIITDVRHTGDVSRAEDAVHSSTGITHTTGLPNLEGVTSVECMLPSSTGLSHTSEDLHARSVTSVECMLRSSTGLSHTSEDLHARSVTRVADVVHSSMGYSHATDDRHLKGVTSVDDGLPSNMRCYYTVDDRPSMGTTHDEGLGQGSMASSHRAVINRRDCDFTCLDDDEFEILGFQDVREKPLRATALQVRKLSKDTEMPIGVQRRTRTKARKSPEFGTMKTSVSHKGSASNTTSSTPKQVATSSKPKTYDDVAKTSKLDCVNSHHERTSRIAVYNISATSDADNAMGGSAQNNTTNISRKLKAKTTEKGKRKVSVYDLEPDDEEELNGTQCLEIMKDRRSAKVFTNQENSLKPTLQIQKVRPQLPSDKTVKSAKGEKSQELLSKKVKSKSQMIDMSIDKKSKKCDVIKSSKLQNAEGNIDTDSAARCERKSMTSLVARPSALNTDSKVPKKVSALCREESSSLSIVNPISASQPSESGIVGETTMPIIRQSRSVGTLPKAPRFSYSNIMTSTPLPNRQRLLTGNNQSVSAVTLSVNKEKTSATDGIAVDNPPLANKTDTNSNTDSITALKQKKRKKPPLLSVMKRRNTGGGTGTAKKMTKISVADSRFSPAEPVLSASFSPEVNQYTTVDATSDSRMCTRLPRYSTASPLHYYEVTEGESKLHSPAERCHKKIIVPGECEGNLRRSSRTRVQTLDWFRCERIRYKRRNSGFVVDGIDSPKPDPQKEFGKRLRQEIRKQLRKEKPVKKTCVPQTPRNLSVHVAMPLPEDDDDDDDDDELTSNPAIPVLNCDINAEVLMECIKVRDQYNMTNPTGEPAADDDPLVICKALRHKSFCGGFITIRPLQCKELQYVPNDTMVFCVMRGKVELTIHKTQQIIESSDIFCVPKGNSYSIRNLRNDEAKLFFVQMKNGDS